MLELAAAPGTIIRSGYVAKLRNFFLGDRENEPCWRTLSDGNSCSEPAVCGAGLCSEHRKEMRAW